MPTPDAGIYSATQLNPLREAIIHIVSCQSANDVPDLCLRLGLAAGDTEESFKSKAKYVQRRLAGRPASDLILTAQKLLQDYESFQLSEALNKVLELNEQRITELTRRRIIGVFKGRSFSTQFRDIDFVDRAFPLKDMKSRWWNNTSHNTMYDDFFQATVQNDDWSNEDIAEALDLLHCSQRQFFRFLESVTDPVCQTPEVQAELEGLINGHLEHDGYRLVVDGKMSGSPVYVVRASGNQSPANDDISSVLKSFDVGTVHARWTAAQDRQISDPEGAITLARTLLEDVCKWIIDEAGESYQEKDDLPVLYKNLSKILNIAPDNHTEAIFKQILGNCQSIVESLGALRNKISDAHSLGPKRVRPASRHAQLAVNLSGSMASFLVLTWNERKPKSVAGTNGAAN